MVLVSTAAFHAGDRGSFPGLGGLKETKLFLPHSLAKLSIVGSLRDREVANVLKAAEWLHKWSVSWAKTIKMYFLGVNRGQINRVPLAELHLKYVQIWNAY